MHFASRIKASQQSAWPSATLTLSTFFWARMYFPWRLDPDRHLYCDYNSSSIKALPDDVDPKYGLHHLNAVVELRADNLDFCEQFRDLDVTIQRLEGQSRGCIHLIGANGQYPHMSTSGQPDITIRTTGVDGLFRGLVNAYWLVADQEHRVIDSQAQTLAAADAELDATDYAYAEGRAYCFMSKSKSSIVKLVCIQEEPDVLLIRDLSIIFPLELLNNHFGTAHS
eukprot:TRINITY_DN9348_c0_g1_i8.p2 TRINITY_DN9348_c0_g1~~TRINITY_DN9348_c0_g1_i8.p2  ORF type:complete len:225 (+),score=28.25 TRINITY_DN9348_c0_g1_i8:847-1521(+)